MSHIFISYNKKNKDYANALADFLQAQGFNVWIDRTGIEVGVDWWDAIVEGLRECSAFIVVMTPESKASNWVKREAFLALQWQKPLFPLLLDGENWELFVLTQFANVSDGAMPDGDLIARLGEHVTPGGKGVNKSTLTLEAQAAHPAPPPTLEAAFNVDAAINAFGTAYRARNWSEALNILGRIRASGEDPSPFDPDALEQRVQDAIEAENRAREQQVWVAERERHYNRLRTIASFDDAEAVAKALKTFWLRFPDYDPDGLGYGSQVISIRPSQGDEYSIPLGSTPSKPSEYPLNEFGNFEDLSISATQIRQAIEEQTKFDSSSFGSIQLVEVNRKTRQIVSSTELLPTPFAWIDIPGALGKKWKDAPYKIGKYPITNAQFKLFVDAGGYSSSQWWTEAGWEAREKGWQHEGAWRSTTSAWTEPRYWRDKKWNSAEQPVVGISWYEAIAFCLWLSNITGESITLPTEDQWQYAAQGDDNRVYPWGNNWECKQCNNSVEPCDSGLTTHVRRFEGEGDSALNVVDMAGNVWEWCLTDYDSGANNIYSEAANRVLRGGSWVDRNSDYFSCDIRNCNAPYDAANNWGFRLATSY